MVEIRPKIWRDLTRSGEFAPDLATNSLARLKPKTKKRVMVAVEIDAMCGGVAVQIDTMCGGVAVEIDVCVEGWRCYGVEGWRCCVMAAWRVLRRGSLEGVVGLWRGGLAGGERERE